MAPTDGPTWQDSPNAGPPAPAWPRATSWECDDCGWVAHQDLLANGRSLRGAVEGHGQYCGRPAP